MVSHRNSPAKLQAPKSDTCVPVACNTEEPVGSQSCQCRAHSTPLHFNAKLPIQHGNYVQTECWHELLLLHFVENLALATQEPPPPNVHLTHLGQPLSKTQPELRRAFTSSYHREEHVFGGLESAPLSPPEVHLAARGLVIDHEEVEHDQPAAEKKGAIELSCPRATASRQGEKTGTFALTGSVQVPSSKIARSSTRAILPSSVPSFHVGQGE